MRRKFTTEELFWRYVSKTASCWFWTGSKNPKGYGYFSSGHKGTSKGALAHRFSWEIHFGPIPAGLNVLHNCPGGDCRHCVNPSHLWLGTQAANIADMMDKGTNRVPIGEDHTSAKLTEQSVREARSLWAAGFSLKSIANVYNVTPQAIRAAVNRKTWKHVH